jgi:sugar diacid utilization regulator
VSSSVVRALDARSADEAHLRYLAAVNSVLTLSLILGRATSSRQVVRLLTTAVPSVAPGHTAMVLHPDQAARYFTRAPAPARARLAALAPDGGALELDESSAAWAFPLGAQADPEPIFLVVTGSEPLSEEERFLLSVLTQQCGTVLWKLDLVAAERARTQQVARLNADLESSVAALTKLMETHRRLNEVAASGAGEEGIAATLAALTGHAVAVEDAHGNVRAASGVLSADKPRREQRQALVRELMTGAHPLFRRGRWHVLANPRVDVLGVIALVDEDRRASDSDLAALEYAATVLSLELARLQSLVDAELRSQRDLAEALLASDDEGSIKTSAHHLGYDAYRPHRVLIAVPGTGFDAGEALFRAIVREVRSLEVASLVVQRADHVVIIAGRDDDWSKLQRRVVNDLGTATDGVRLAVGSAYPGAWQTVHSYREAQFVADLIRSPASGIGAPVVSFEELGVYRLLSSATDPAGVERFMNDRLGPLIAYDRRYRSSTVLTLAQYFDAGCDADRAAASLCVHRNTVKYRLKRIRDILGHDIIDGATRLDLHLATKAWLILDGLWRPVESDAGSAPPKPSQSRQARTESTTSSTEGTMHASSPRA